MVIEGHDYSCSDGLVSVCIQTTLSNDVDFLVSVEEVKMHLQSQLDARTDMTKQLNRKRRLVRNEFMPCGIVALLYNSGWPFVYCLYAWHAFSALTLCIIT